MAIVEPNNLPAETEVTGDESLVEQEAAGGAGSVKKITPEQIAEYAIIKGSPSRTVMVDPDPTKAIAGKIFTTIQAAINYVATVDPPPSDTNRWVVEVAPGNYQEDLDASAVPGADIFIVARNVPENGTQGTSEPWRPTRLISAGVAGTMFTGFGSSDTIIKGFVVEVQAGDTCGSVSMQDCKFSCDPAVLGSVNIRMAGGYSYLSGILPDAYTQLDFNGVSMWGGLATNPGSSQAAELSFQACDFFGTFQLDNVHASSIMSVRGCFFGQLIGVVVDGALGAKLRMENTSLNGNTIGANIAQIGPDPTADYEPAPKKYADAFFPNRIVRADTDPAKAIPGKVYTTIQAAIDYAVGQTPSYGDQWTVLCRGNFVENITIPDNVRVRAEITPARNEQSGTQELYPVTSLTCAAGPLITFSDSDAVIEGFLLSVTAPAILVVGSGRIVNCRMEGDLTADVTAAQLRVSGGFLASPFTITAPCFPSFEDVVFGTGSVGIITDITAASPAQIVLRNCSLENRVNYIQWNNTNPASFFKVENCKILPGSAQVISGTTGAIVSLYGTPLSGGTIQGDLVQAGPDAVEPYELALVRNIAPSRDTVTVINDKAESAGKNYQTPQAALTYLATQSGVLTGNRQAKLIIYPKSDGTAWTNEALDFAGVYRTTVIGFPPSSVGVNEFSAAHMLDLVWGVAGDALLRNIANGSGIKFQNINFQIADGFLEDGCAEIIHEDCEIYTSPGSGLVHKTYTAPAFTCLGKRGQVNIQGGLTCNTGTIHTWIIEDASIGSIGTISDDILSGPAGQLQITLRNCRPSSAAPLLPQLVNVSTSGASSWIKLDAFTCPYTGTAPTLAIGSAGGVLKVNDMHLADWIINTGGGLVVDGDINPQATDIQGIYTSPQVPALEGKWRWKDNGMAGFVPQQYRDGDWRDASPIIDPPEVTW